MVVKRKIGGLICETVASLGWQSTVSDAAVRMARDGVGSLVVTRNGKVYGLFTEHDLLARVVAKALDPQQTLLADVCTVNLISISHDQSASAAMRVMRDNGCRRLLVYRNEEFLGLVNLTDVAHALTERYQRKDWILNAVGATVLLVVLAVIGFLLAQFPAMLELAQRLNGG